jgi:phosphoribosylformimino-5-aminoimidazole carboxamide ribotide isomerase
MIEIIPAIDIIDGKLVRLSQGDYDLMKVYSNEPLDMAKTFEQAGIRRLHVVDLDGARASHIVNYKTLEAIATQTSLTVDFGGGLKSADDVRIAFESGAGMVTIGSAAVRQPALFLEWLEQYGADKIILGADIKEGKIAVSGWTESSDARWQAFIQSFVHRGVTQVISTDISRDGMLSGPSTELYKDMMKEFPTLKVIASGGVSCMSDVLQLEEAGVPAVILGKAIYEGRITLAELTKYQQEHA